MKLYDEYKINDIKETGYTPKGMVKILDNDGNVIFEKHNLVVNSGRNLMFALFLKYFNYSTENEILQTIHNATDTKLEVNLSYDADNRQTTGETILTDIKYDATYTDTITASTIDHISINDLDRSITFNVNIVADSDFLINNKLVADSSESFRFNQIYLTYSINNDSYKELFSRVAMDPVFLGRNMKYQLEYTLYF